MSNELKVGIIVTNNKNEVLLLKEKGKKNTSFLWNIVKGSYGDAGQETIFETAIRECQEEAGVKITVTGLLGCYISQQNNKIRTQITFIAKVDKGLPRLASKKEQLLRNENIEKLEWFTKENIQKMQPKEFITARTYQILQDWIIGKSFPPDSVKQIKM